MTDSTLTPAGNYRRMVSTLSTPLNSVKGVGPKVAEKLAQKGLRTLGDALVYLPLRYEDRTRLVSLAQLEEGVAVAFSGELVRFEERGYSRRRTLEGVLRDKSGASVVLKWFRGNFQWLKKRYNIGDQLIGYGTPRIFRGVREIHHPDLDVLDDGPGAGMDAVAPVYSEVEGVPQRTLRKIMGGAVEVASRAVVNLVPQIALTSAGEDPSHWEKLGAVWRQLHCPSGGGAQMDERLERCRRMVVLEEFFFLQLGLLLKQSGGGGDGVGGGIAFTPDFSRIKPFLATLPFELTGAQRRVLSEIRADMEAARPMHRLLQGDVGSGKTLVAIISALMAVESGHQAAVMAPTEVLAEQHFRNFEKLLSALAVDVELLTGSVTGSERASVLDRIETGEADIVVGTHALIQEGVKFRRLGLVVVDEQHRFGVMQRAELAKKGDEPDLLVMTATPIPRSLSMTVYGDLNLSVIDELPPGRRPIRTSVVRPKGREGVYRQVRDEIAKGRQAYVVYPLVEESEKVELRAAVEMFEALKAEVFPDLEVGLLHGRMKSEEKERQLAAFSGGKTQVLVCTTVIEVGIDVPNATVMVIEHAERFGLSQLHQLRGRVGRGEHQSYCALIAEGYLSDDAYQRLRTMERTEDGFIIAEEDLKIRGPGDMLGTRQSGMPDFRIGHIVRDGNLMETARTMARKVIEKDPGLTDKGNRLIREILYERWAEKLALVKSG